MASRRSSSLTPPHDEFTPPPSVQVVQRINQNDVRMISPSRSFPCDNILHQRLPTSPRLDKNRRSLFALKVKYLLGILKDLGENALLQNTKTIIATCTRMNRLGDPAYSPLEIVLESSLRSLVGNVYWEMAQSRARRQLKQQLHQRCAAVASMQSAAVLRRRNSVPI
jgi:hypothetical protein